MTNTPIQVTNDLSTVLAQIDRKLETLQKEAADFRKEVADFRTETFVAIESVKGDIKSVKGDIKALDEKVNGLKAELGKTTEDIKELKSSQKNQIWSLIVLAFTAVLGMIGALARVLFAPNP
jgi:peptidoglycan hydrolase CwlO-like protein